MASTQGNPRRDRRGSRRRESPRRPANQGSRTASSLAARPLPPRGGRQRKERDLEGEPSPWEERAIHRWKRRRVATDSSVEKGPEIGASAGAVLTSTSGNGRLGRRQVPSAGASVRVGFARHARRHTLRSGITRRFVRCGSLDAHRACLGTQRSSMMTWGSTFGWIGASSKEHRSETHEPAPPLRKRSDRECGADDAER